jgi:protein-tyrosine phosphatase
MGTIDFHNHLMPGVDDGAQTIEEAAAGLAAFRADGVSTVVTTPHVDASTTVDKPAFEQRFSELDTAFAQLSEHAGAMRVERGVELQLNVPEPDLSDARVRLAGGKFFLMEFPSMTVPPQSARAIERIVATGYQPIIAHPERYHGIGTNLHIIGEWKERGALLQVNGGSLLGRYGPQARENALELLRRGWSDYLSSDYHARGPTQVTQYRALLERLEAAEQAHTMMETNPARMLDGAAPLPVAPLSRRKPTLWGRVSAMFT